MNGTLPIFNSRAVVRYKTRTEPLLHALNPPSRLRDVMDEPDDGPFVEAPQPQPRRWQALWITLAVLALTALGGGLRFYRLDRPYVWGDEASTYRRVSGEYGEMLKTLERDPFTPLFYSAEWALRTWGHVHLTPFWLRLIPAIAGTLMVPAMYFLARQLTSVRTSLVVAVLTCCSSWLINYSRDAKMYMTFWLFVALTAGCFFWWLRKHTWTSWLCWIAAGCAMMGLNLWGGVLMALLPIFLLTARRVHWAMGVGFLIGFAVIASGPVGYFTLFNDYVDKAEGEGGYGNITWVPWRNEGADGLDLVRDSGAAYLYSFTFQQENFPDARRDPSRMLFPPQPVLVAAIVALTVIGSLLVVGLMPWRRATDPPLATAKEPWWRSTFWIALWLTVPTYVFYCMSFAHPQTPRDWLIAANDFTGHGWWVFALLAVGLVPLFTRIRVAGPWLLIAATAIVLAMLGYAFWHQYRMELAPEHLWYRPIGAIGDWLHALQSRWIAWPLLVCIPAIAIARSAPTWRRRGGSVLAFVLFTAVVLALLAGVYAGTDVVKQHMLQKGIRPTSIWVPRYLGFIWPALVIAIGTLLCRLPTWPLRYGAIASIVALNLFVGYHRVLDNTEAPVERVVADILAGEKYKSDTRTFVPRVNVEGGPGATGWWNMTGVYYLTNTRDDITGLPRRILRDESNSFAMIRPYDGPGEIANELNKASHDGHEVTRVIIWRAQDAVNKPLRPATDIARKLGPEWILASEEIIPVRYHWCWATRYLYVRREFKKQPAPSTQPIARLETAP